jgi:thioredoxin 1
LTVPASAEAPVEPSANAAPTQKAAAMSHVVYVGQANFQAEVLQSETPVVVDFFANWCPPCRALGPILDQLSTEFAGQIKFVKINSDEEPSLAQAYNVSALPTLIFIEQGQVVGDFAGLPQANELRAELKQWLQAVEAEKP